MKVQFCKNVNTKTINMAYFFNSFPEYLFDQAKILRGIFKSPGRLRFNYMIMPWHPIWPPWPFLIQILLQN